MSLPSKKTKIIGTIGPATQSQQTLERLIRAGMNITRVNLAHGDLGRHAQAIYNIRAAAAAVGQQVAIWGDLPGPKMRVGRLVGGSVRLERSQPFILQTAQVVGDTTRASMSIPVLPQTVKPGDQVYLNDGFIRLQVEKVEGQEIHCRVQAGGELRAYDGVNLPGIDLGISAFTRQDRACLAFAAEQRLDAVSPSFIQNAADIAAVRQAAAAMDYSPFLLAKIERSLAVQNLDAILKSADAIVVARGDLGLETPIEEIALLQKRIIRQANLIGKPVVTATHMLQSMVCHQLPTRAEVADVTNAILDGTDCLTLSAETALGDHPEDASAGREISPDDRTLSSVHATVKALSPAVVVVPALSGATARGLSKFRLPVWIVAVSPNASVCQALQFSYGVYPLHLSVYSTEWSQYAAAWLQQHGVTGHMALLTQGPATGRGDSPKDIKIVKL
jgi:pyruvate kinase